MYDIYTATERGYMLDLHNRHSENICMIYIQRQTEVFCKIYTHSHSENICMINIQKQTEIICKIYTDIQRIYV